MARTRILKPYERRRDLGWFRRLLVGAGLIGLATFYGMMIAVLPPWLLVIPLTPILILVALILWMLPDTGHVYADTIERFMLWLVGLGVVWPAYVALNAPGLPWVTPTRVAVFALLAVFAFNLSTSQILRERVVAAMRGVPILFQLFWGFWAITTFSIFLSSEPGFSINKYANNQIYWTMMFAASAYLTTRPGYLPKLARIFVVSTIIVACLGILEFKLKRVFWLDHLPSFLKVDAEYLARIMDTQSRAGTDIYRSRGTFATSLSFSEYLAMTLPLVVHFATRARSVLAAGLLWAGIAATAVAMYLTNARSAMVGLLVTMVLYPFFVAWRARKTNKTSIMGTAVLFAYPIAVAVLAGLVIFWQRLHVMVLGGGMTKASSEARAVQWKEGLQKLLTNPIGHGVGRSAEVLNYRNPAGDLTIDTYYLSLLLEYGVLGFLAFMLMFILAGWYGWQGYNRAKTESGLLLAPLSIGLINFIIIKAVLSVEVNAPIAFIMLGALVGVIGQQGLVTTPVRRRARALPSGSLAAA